MSPYDSRTSLDATKTADKRVHLTLADRRLQIWDCPVLLVCFNVGAVVAKQSLVHAKRVRTDHDSLFQALHGLIFFNNLQLPSEETTDWRRPGTTTLFNLKSSKGAGRIERELQTVATVSSLFEDLTLPIPTLSTWEEGPGKLKGLSYFQSGKIQKCIQPHEHTARIATAESVIFDKVAGDTTVCLLDSRGTQEKTLVDFIDRCFTPEAWGSTFGSTPLDKMGASPEVSNLQSPRNSLPELLSPQKVARQHGSAHGATATQFVIRQSQSLPNVLKARDLPPDPKLPCHHVDAGVQVDDFIARDDVLQDIDTALSQAATSTETSDSVHCLTLTGAGGMGKTSIAAQYLRNYKHKYDMTYWIRADSESKMLDAFLAIGTELQLITPSQMKDICIVRRIVWQWFGKPVRSFDEFKQRNKSRARWLLVFDNVEDDDDLLDFLPTSGGGSILLTSRNPLAGNTIRRRVKHFTPISLEPWTSAEAIEFLRGVVSDHATRQDDAVIAEVAARLDCLPLALRQMGTVMQDRKLDFRTFLELYNDEVTSTGLHGSTLPQSNTRYEYNLSTVLRLEKVPDSCLSVLQVMSLLDPDLISSEFMQAVVSTGNSTYPTTPKQLETAIQKLWRSSLVQYRPVSGSKELTLHRTVQDTVRANMTVLQMISAYELATALLLAAWPLKGQVWHYPVDHWPQCAAVLPHAVSLLRNYTSNKDQSKWPVPDSSMGRMFVYAGWFCHERGDSRQASSFFDTVETMCSRWLNSDTALLQDVWMCQGCVATETNRGAACLRYNKLFFESTIKSCEEPKDTADFDRLAIVHNELAIAYFIHGDLEQASGLFEIARDYAEKPARVSDTADSMFTLASTNLGLVRWVDGEYEDALNILMRAFHVYEQRPIQGGKDDFAPGRLMHALGNLRFSQAQHDANDDIMEAFGWHYMAYEHYQKTIGNDHHRAADVCHRLAQDLMCMHRYIEAQQSIDHALSIYESKNCYTPELMRTTYLKATLLGKMGNTTDSMRLLEAAREMFRAYHTARGQDTKQGELSQEDFDAVVTFWSR
ncbi:hypothetical protein LTR86_003100 [Recurvomyces mirabilis]|nr:hypothetical protein LTR86_003100 [Recurvomyces mirabilis]